MVTWPMTSRNLERSNSWPQYAPSAISQKRLHLETLFQRTTNRNGIWAFKWSRDWWRHATLKGQTRDPISKTAGDIETPFQRTTNWKWHTGYQIVASRDLQRCCELVRSAILATAWLLVEFSDCAFVKS